MYNIKNGEYIEIDDGVSHTFISNEQKNDMDSMVLGLVSFWIFCMWNFLDYKAYARPQDSYNSVVHNAYHDPFFVPLVC